MPGTVTLICGDPGDGKSFFILQAVAHWHREHEEVALYELEDDKNMHLMRAMSQSEADSRLMDDDWMRDNVDTVRHALDRHREWLASFRRCVFDAPDRQVTLDELAEWVEARAKAGCRIIAIDPITLAASSSKPWIDDLQFLFKVKTVVREYGASLILVTHPKKGRKAAIGLDELAGGAGYQRFVHCVLWLQRHKKPETKTMVFVRDKMRQTHQTEINRTLHICKARNGIGHGWAIGFDFRGGSLLFAEQGIICDD